MRKKNKKVYGIGINDATYQISTKILKDGKYVVERCQFYRVWLRMLERCYSSKYQDKSPTYKGCSVCYEWLTFSNFKSWMEQQDWEGKQLDKDLKVKGNKVYSPDTCMFVHPLINSFITDSGSIRGDYMIGVSLNTKSKVNPFQSSCCNPFSKKREHLGYFKTELEAHEAWIKKKKEHVLNLCESTYIDDIRVANALINYYEDYQII